MKSRYVIGVLFGAVIGIILSYLYSQGDSAAYTSNLWVGALIGALVGLFMVSAASVSGSKNADGCGAERPQFG